MNSPEKSLFSFEQVTAARESRVPATVLDWGLELRLWVAICVTGLSLFSARSLGLPLDGTTKSAVAIVFFATLALYNLDGSLDAPCSTISAEAPTRLRRLHLALTGLTSIVLLVLVARLSPRALLLTGSGALACSLYAIPLTFRRKSKDAGTRTFRLKALPFFKAPFVGCSVGTAAVWVPMWAHESALALFPALALTCALSLYCSANALLFDIPDLNEDQRTAVGTLPVRWGLGGTRWASRVLVLAGLLISAVFSVQGAGFAHSVGLFCLGAVLLAFTELFHFRTPRRTVAVWVDGALLLPLSFQALFGI